MKRLRKLPRAYRDLIGGFTVLGGLFIFLVLLGDIGALILSLPLVMFFVWLCPELWGGA